MEGYKLCEPITPSEIREYYRLRFEVLRKPWNQPEISTQDEWENQSLHVLVLDESNQAAATGRLQFNSATEGQLRSMAVRPDLQGKGLGGMVLDYIEVKAREKKLSEIILDAREHAVHFYEKHGYRIIADSYVLFGVIPHFKMQKIL